jgi:hypothetical protein
MTYASRAERRVGAVAGRLARKYDIPSLSVPVAPKDCRFAVAIGQEGDGKPVRQQAVRRNFNGTPMAQSRLRL